MQLMLRFRQAVQMCPPEQRILRARQNVQLRRKAEGADGDVAVDMAVAKSPLFSFSFISLLL